MHRRAVTVNSPTAICLLRTQPVNSSSVWTFGGLYRWRMTKPGKRRNFPRNSVQHSGVESPTPFTAIPTTAFSGAVHLVDAHADRCKPAPTYVQRNHAPSRRSKRGAEYSCCLSYGAFGYNRQPTLKTLSANKSANFSVIIP
jgi:hypothetical protein